MATRVAHEAGTVRWAELAATIHTHESFARAVMANALAVASRTKPNPDGSITVKGEITFTPLAVAEEKRASFCGCTTVKHCWTDEAAGQSVCVDEVLCGDFDLD